MKVLSGPAALRDAAIEALKQYRYEPAILHGKARCGSRDRSHQVFV